MPRQRDPRRDEAFEIWKIHKGSISNREIAERLSVPEKTISAWKLRDKWNVESNVVLQKNECSTTKELNRKNKQKNKVHEESLQSGELTEMQRLFCFYYVKSFNATQAAIDAGYSEKTAYSQGQRLLKNVEVQKQIQAAQTDFQALLADEAANSIRTIVQLRDTADNDSVRLKAAQDILDRLGLKAPEKQEVSMKVKDEAGEKRDKLIGDLRTSLTEVRSALGVRSNTSGNPRSDGDNEAVTH